MKRPGHVVAALLACSSFAVPAWAGEEPEKSWALTEAAAEHVTDPALRDRIFKALDAAERAGTDPSISKFHVRAGTIVEHEGVERAIVGGNSEYAGYPEAIHGETSLMNHVISTSSDRGSAWARSTRSGTR